MNMDSYMFRLHSMELSPLEIRVNWAEINGITSRDKINRKEYQTWYKLNQRNLLNLSQTKT